MTTGQSRLAAPRLAPWEAEPYRLWSLWDMEIYKAEYLAALGYNIGETATQTHFIDTLPSISQMIANFAAKEVAEQMAERVRDQSGGRVTVSLPPEMQLIGVAEKMMAPLIGAARRENTEALNEAISSVGNAHLSPRWAARLQRLKESIDSSDAKTMAIRLADLFHDLLEELKEPLFLYVPHERRRYFDQTEPPFGQVVADAFPGANRDIAAATRCIALDESTASVFHSMRVLEHGLKPLAERFGVPYGVDSWHAVIRGIEQGIKALRDKGKDALTAQDRIDLTNYSEAASQFRYFKDAWRNHVTHGSEHYDQRAAETVWEHTRSFMQKMAEIL